MELTNIAKAIMLGFGVLGPALGLGMIFSKALEGIARNPEAMDKKIWLVFLGAAMVELFGLAAVGFIFIVF